METQNKFITPNQQIRNKYIPCESTGKDLSYEKYIEFLTSKGIYLNPKCWPSLFRLKNGLQYPGMATSDHIGCNEILVRIPKKLVLSSFMAVQCEQLKGVFEEPFYHQELTWQDRVLKTYLLYLYGKRQEENVWYQMIKHFSREIDNLAFWPLEDIQKFDDSTIQKIANKQRQVFQNQWTLFSQFKQKYQILKGPQWTKQNYQWIHVHITSRSFGKQLQFTSMVPICELFNHHAVDGYYDVQAQKQNKQIEQNASNQQENDNESVTTDGSYMSQEEIQEGEFDYTGFEENNVKQKTKNMVKNNDTNQGTIIKEKCEQIQKKIKLDIEQNPLSIIFGFHILQELNLIKRDYLCEKKDYTQTMLQLDMLSQSILTFDQLFILSSKVWASKFSQTKHQTGNRPPNKLTSYQLPKASENKTKYITFPQKQSNQYENFILTTGPRDSFRPNNQVYFCYGRNSNRMLLKWYGFCIEGNKYQHVWVEFELLEWIQGFKGIKWEIMEIMKERQISVKKKFKLKYNRLNLELIFFFRFKNWQLKGNQIIEQLFKVKNYQKQVQILQNIKNQLETKLKSYQESYDLTNPTLTYHEYFITLYHKEKQKILQQQISFVKILIKFNKTLQKQTQIEKVKQAFTSQEKFIFRHYLSQFQ